MAKFSYYLTRAPFKWDFILFPILSALMDLILNVTNLQIDIKGVLDIHLWINSFVITFLTYMIFEVISIKIVVIKRFKYTWSAISFAFSTFIGGLLNYSLKDNLTPEKWFWSIALAFLFGFVSLYFIYWGANRGEEKAYEEIEKESKKYATMLDELDDSKRSQLLSLLNKALELDDFTFDMIVALKSKEEIKGFIFDIENNKSANE